MFERLTGANHKELGFHTYIGAKNPYSVALTLGELLLDNTNPKYRPHEILNDVFDRLASYEDSGLSPEQIKALTADKDEQARKTRQLEEGLKSTLKVLETLNYRGGLGLDIHKWLRDEMQTVNTLLGSEEDEKE